MLRNNCFSNCSMQFPYVNCRFYNFTKFQIFIYKLHKNIIISLQIWKERYVYVDFMTYMLDEIYCATQRTHKFLRACASRDMYISKWISKWSDTSRGRLHWYSSPIDWDIVPKLKKRISTWRNGSPPFYNEYNFPIGHLDLA